MRIIHLLTILLLILPTLVTASGVWQPVRNADWEFDLKRICFVNEEKGFILSWHHLLVTEDGGQHWQEFDFPDSLVQDITGVWTNIHFMDELRGWIIETEGNLLHTIDGGKNWFRERALPEGLQDCAFADSSRGCMVGYFGNIIYTKNGGKHWTQSEKITSLGLLDVCFVDNLGWASGARGTILHTTDGGEHWKVLSKPASYSLFQICFVNSLTGWTGGLEGTLMKTTNGGKNWQPVVLENIHSTIHSIYFQNADTGWVAGGGDGFLFRTTNGGDSWERVELPLLNTVLDFQIIGETAWISGTRGTILRSTDAGQTWQPQMQATSDDLHAISFSDPNHGWAIGMWQLIHTTDGGITWNDLGKYTGDDITFADSLHGWFVNVDYGIYRTEDGGQNWDLAREGMNYYKLNFIDPRNGWVARAGLYDATELFQTRDGGKSWKQIYTFNDRMIFSLFFLDSLAGYASGNYGSIYKTVDGGLNWEVKKQSIQRNWAMLDVSFINPEVGWAVDWNQLVWHTENGGDLWEMQTPPTFFEAVFTSVHFADENHGWVAGTYGVLLFTEDGGETWSNEFSWDFGYFWWDMDFTDRNHGWVAGMYGAIYKWTGNELEVVRPPQNVPAQFSLQPGFPNPFSLNTGTQIRFTLPKPEPVRLSIFNNLGQLVREFQPGLQLPGNHTLQWDGRNQSGQPVAAGTYFYQLQAGEARQAGKVLLVR